MKKILITLSFLFLFSMQTPAYAAYCENKKTDVLCRQTLETRSFEIAKDFHLKLLTTGLGSIVDFHDAKWCLVFTSKNKLEKEQACALASTIQSLLLNVMYEDPCFKKYMILAHPHRQEGENNRKFQLNNDRMAIKIAFWDEAVNRPLYPYIADIRIFEDKIHYSYANPETGALENTTTEPFTYLKIIKQES